MLENLVGAAVVVDLRGTFVCLGTLASFDEAWLELRDADLHDLRDGHAGRESYVAESIATGVKRNRKRVLLARTDVVGVALLTDVVDG